MLNKEMLEKDFMSLIKEGKAAIALISDSDKKALACAQLAQAIASTGVLNMMELKAATGILSADKIEEVVKDAVEEETATKKEKKTTKSSRSTKSKAKGKDALKNEAAKEPAKVEEEVPVVEETEPVVEETTETVEAEVVPTIEETADNGQAVDAEHEDVELVEEWTEEMCEVKAEDLNAYNWYLDVWGEERMCELVSSFFEGRETDLSAIRPTNITGFVTFLYSVYLEENPDAEQ